MASLVRLTAQARPGFGRRLQRRVRRRYRRSRLLNSSVPRGADSTLKSLIGKPYSSSMVFRLAGFSR